MPEQRLIEEEIILDDGFLPGEWSDEERIRQRQTIELQPTESARLVGHDNLAGGVIDSLLDMARIGARREGRDEHFVARIAALSALLGRLCQHHQSDCDELFLAAPLHDIGKMAMPDDLLKFIGAYDRHQRSLFVDCLQQGVRLLSNIPLPAIQMAALIGRQQHECFDGSGVPFALVGGDIFWATRVVVIIKSFDAMLAGRAYRERLSDKKSVARFYTDRAHRYDPATLKTFLEHFDTFVQVRQRINGHTHLALTHSVPWWQSLLSDFSPD